MKVSDIDKNFEVKTVEKTQDCDYYDAKQPPFNFSGGFYEEENKKFVRVPTALAAKISRGVSILGNITAGMRVRFSTDSDFIELKVTYEKYFRMNTAPLTASAGFSLMEDLPEGGQAFTQIFFPVEGDDKGFIQRKALKGGKVRNYTLYFPLYNDLKSVEIGVKAASFVGSGKAYKNIKPVLWYGSSITQGACASRADNTYQELVSESTGFDYTVLGFSGGAKAEYDMACVLKNADCDIFVCCYDHNAPDADYLAATHERLYKTFRENPAHKSVPVMFLSKTYDKNDSDMIKRFRAIRRTYIHAKKADETVYLIDGGKIFPQKLKEHCAVDGCHPTDLGLYFIAKALLKTISRVK